MKYLNESDADYVENFTNLVWQKLKKTFLPVFVTLLGIYGSTMTGNIATMPYIDRMKEFALYFVCIEGLFGFLYSVISLANIFFHYKVRSKLTLPYGISVDDISPYSIKEERTEKIYTLNSKHLTFDVINTTTYTVKGGCSRFDFIEHCFSALNLNDPNDLSVHIKSISGKRIIETEAVKEKTSERCVVQAVFETALEPNEEAKYQIVLKYDNYQCIYSNNGNIPIKHCKWAELSKKRIILSITFPRDYRIKHPEYLVESNSNVRMTEVEKICEKENESLQNQMNRKNITLTLIVNKPVPSLRYSLLWKLPDIDLLKKEHFINQSQLQQLKEKKEP